MARHDTIRHIFGWRAIASLDPPYHLRFYQEICLSYCDWSLRNEQASYVVRAENCSSTEADSSIGAMSFRSSRAP